MLLQKIHIFIKTEHCFLQVLNQVLRDFNASTEMEEEIKTLKKEMNILKERIKKLEQITVQSTFVRKRICTGLGCNNVIENGSICADCNDL